MKSHRGTLTVADLVASCRLDRVTFCWHWLGAMSAGCPQMWTFDYRRGEKRVVTGTLGAYMIAFGEPPLPGRLVYRSCWCNDCVNPVHLRTAGSRQELGAIMRRSGHLKGTHLEARRANARKAMLATGVKPTSRAKVRLIRRAPEHVTDAALAKQLAMQRQTVSRIRRGDRRRGV